jgi:hypothetical protein
MIGRNPLPLLAGLILVVVVIVNPFDFVIKHPKECNIAMPNIEKKFFVQKLITFIPMMTFDDVS